MLRGVGSLSLSCSFAACAGVLAACWHVPAAVLVLRVDCGVLHLVLVPA